MLVALLFNYTTSGATISVTNFDNLWALNDPDNNTLRRAAFTNVYSMVLTTCIDMEGQQYPCWQLVGAFWPAFLAFSFTPDFLCSELCPEVRFHLEH